MPDARCRDQADKPYERFRWVFKSRGLLMAPSMAFLMLCHWWEAESRLLAFGLGGALFGLGLGLRVWSQLHLRYRLKVKMLLTQTGPYRYVRNPVYIGNILILLGCCFLARLAWFAPIMFLHVAAVYHFVVLHEECHLRNKYGPDYGQFQQAAPRWFPRFRRSTAAAPRETGHLLPSSLVAEAHNLLLILPFIAKEAFY